MLLIELLKNVKYKYKIFCFNKYYNYSEISFRTELEKWFLKSLNYKLNLDSPKSFNEKIQWLKLYDSTEIKAELTDKYKVRDWVIKEIGEKYLIPLIGVYDKFDDIKFDELPDQFVLKTNHASSTNKIVVNKSNLNLQEEKIKFTRWLKTNYAFNKGFELHYGMIEPKIICEKYMGDNLNDYKFFCFNGNPEFIWVDVNRYKNHCRNTYDMNWNELPFVIDKFDRVNVNKPLELDNMIELSRILSKNFSFVRVDFYEIDGMVYFGEMTFTSSSGRDPFSPDEYDYIYGEKLVLPEKKIIPVDQIKKVWGNSLES